MKTDMQIQEDVQQQLRWNPILNATQIGVAVKNGIVTLSGQVDSYAKKIEAEKDALKVAGVRAIAEDMHIDVSPVTSRTDAEIAEAIINALKWHSEVQDEKIKVKVEDGIVDLEGEVEWEYQRRSALNAIQNITGVKLVLDFTQIKQKTKALDIEKKICAAFERHATMDAQQIKVEVSDNKVTLRGIVRSYAEREDAEAAAWAGPGITSVDNCITIGVPQLEDSF